jgi:ketosteroid isomerase-like protein
MSILRRGAFVLALAPLVVLTPALAAMDGPVAERVEAFRAAQFVADGKALEALCAPELSYSHSDGRVEDRAAFIAGSTTGRSKYNKLEYRDPKVTTVGDVATVRFNWVGESVATDGKISNTNLHVLMVWQKQGSEWKLLARAATKL